MASLITRAVLKCQRNLPRVLPKRNIALSTRTESRNVELITKTGGVPDKPKQIYKGKFPMTKVTLVFILGTWFGGEFARETATFMEEYSLFSPLDKEDD